MDSIVSVNVPIAYEPLPGSWQRTVIEQQPYSVPQTAGVFIQTIPNGVCRFNRVLYVHVLLISLGSSGLKSSGEHFLLANYNGNKCKENIDTNCRESKYSFRSQLAAILRYILLFRVYFTEWLNVFSFSGTNIGKCRAINRFIWWFSKFNVMFQKR